MQISRSYESNQVTVKYNYYACPIPINIYKLTGNRDSNKAYVVPFLWYVVKP